SEVSGLGTLRLEVLRLKVLRLKILGLMHFVAANEDDEAIARGDDIAFAERRIVHGPVRCFSVLLFGLRRRNCLRAGIGDKFLRAAAGFVDSLLPLFARERGIREVISFLATNALWRAGEASADQQRGDPNHHDETSGITCRVCLGPTAKMSLARLPEREAI